MRITFPATLASILGTLALTLCSCVTQRSAALQRFEFEQPQMGVPFRILLYAADRRAADQAAQAAFDRIKQLNAIMSDYEEDSELSKLSRTAGQGQAVRVSDDLWRVLVQSQKLSERSDGAFDVTVGPCVSLWRRARRLHQIPESDRIAEALKATGYQKLRLDLARHTVELTVPRMRLDLGAIAKGYAVDQALATLSKNGIKRALVAGSGDMAAGEPPPGKRGWRVEVAAHDATNAPPAHFVLLRNLALATSGDVFQNVEIEGRRYSHIVNPHTGIGLTDRCLVNIIAPDCTTADSLATTVCVLGPQAGLALVESTPGVAALVTRRPADQVEQIQSRRFARHCVAP